MALAPCCYNGLVAKHQSDAAREMRAEIATLIARGKSDNKILDPFVQRHGKRIWSEPEGTTGVVLRIIPWFTLLVGLFAVVLVVKRLRRRAPQPAAGPSGGVDVPDELW